MELVVPLLVLVGLSFLVLIWLVKGFFRVAEEERVVIEWSWGGYWFTAAKGLNWRPKILSRVRAKLDIREQGMSIFDAPDLWIDLVDGSMRPRDARLVVRIVDPLTYDGPPRPIYVVVDWKREIKSLAETQASSYLRSLTIEQALQEGQAGFDIIYQMDQRRLELSRAVKRLKREIEEAEDDTTRRAKEFERELLLRKHRNLLGAIAEIAKTKQEWGIEVTQIFIPEYDLSKEVLDARNRVQAEERKARAEEFSLQRRVLESAGTYAQIRQFLIDKGLSPEEASELAQSLWTYLRGTEKNSLRDIRLGGDGGIAGLAAALAEIVRAPSPGPSGSVERADKKKKREGGREIRTLGGGTRFATNAELKRLGLPAGKEEEEDEGEEE